MPKGRKKSATATPKLPRVPLPPRPGRRHDDETKRRWRDRKHKKSGPGDES